MKKYIKTGLLLAGMILFAGCGHKVNDDHSQHTGHPASESEIQRLSHFAEPTTTKVVSSQSVVNPEQKLYSNVFDAYGFVALDERRSEQVAARVGGRIEKLYVRYEHQYVRKGDKILDLYSPDLNTFQEELLFAQKVDPDGETPKHAAHKLKLLGITDHQIQTILETGKTSYTLSIYSPNNGYVFYNPSSTALGPSSSMTSSPPGGGTAGAMEMGNGSPQMSAPQPISAESPVREGAYVSAGQTLFWINDLRQVWGILSLDNLPPDAISANDSVNVVSELIPEGPIKTRVGFIEPQYAPGQKFIQVRVYLPNPDKVLRVNSLLKGTIHSSASNALTLPASAVLHLGTRQAVWKKVDETEQGTNIFQIQYVTLGPVSQGRVTVLQGLTADDKVALDAGYLVDRESLIQTE